MSLVVGKLSHVFIGHVCLYVCNKLPNCRCNNFFRSHFTEAVAQNRKIDNCLFENLNCCVNQKPPFVVHTYRCMCIWKYVYLCVCTPAVVLLWSLSPSSLVDSWLISCCSILFLLFFGFCCYFFVLLLLLC